MKGSPETLENKKKTEKCGANQSHYIQDSVSRTTISKQRSLVTSTAAPPAEQDMQKRPSPRTAATREGRRKWLANGQPHVS